MDNHYSNPFQNIEDDQVINLQDNNKPKPAASFSNLQPVMFNSSTDNLLISNENINTGGSNAFDPMNPNIEQQSFQDNLNEDGDPPLLQDIGINIQLVKQRIIAVITFQEPDKNLIESPDLVGPILITLSLGILLLLGEKFHFSDIQSNFILGNIFMYFFLNFMAKTQDVSLYSIMCFLGYSILPMLILAIFGIFIYLNNTFGVVMSLGLACWSAKTAGDSISFLINRFNEKTLIYYPLFLFYINYALIIIF